MQTVETPSREETIERVKRRDRWLIVLVWVLVLALIGLGIWLVLDAFVFDDQSDAEALVLDYQEAWRDLDSERVASFFDEGGSFTFVNEGAVWRGPDEIAAYVEEYPADATLEIGPVIASDGHYLATTYRWDGIALQPVVGISVIQLWPDGEKILHHYVYGEMISE